MALFQTDEASRDPSENRLIVRSGTVTIGGIALSATRSKLYRHEDAIRIVHVISFNSRIPAADNRGYNKEFRLSASSP